MPPGHRSRDRDRIRVQTFLPASTAAAIDFAAEGMGLNRGQALNRLLHMALLSEGYITDASWPRPARPPSRKVHPIEIPLPLCDWLATKTGPLATAAAAAIDRGLLLEADGNKVYLAPDEWQENKRVSVRLSPKAHAVIRSRRERYGLTWHQVATAYLILTWLDDTGQLPVS